MTEIEAIKYFEDANRTHNMVCVLPKSDIGKCVIHTLKKQIPKKVVRVKLRQAEWGSGVYCPVCESEQTHTEFFTVDGTEPDEKTAWCSRCGQKLDWSE